MTGLAASHGSVTVVWSQREGHGWNLKARTYDGSRFGPTESVTTGDNNNLFHRVAAIPQRQRPRRVSELAQGPQRYLSALAVGGKWTPEIMLSDAQRDAPRQRLGSGGGCGSRRHRLGRVGQLRHRQLQSLPACRCATASPAELIP